ncbi:TPA: ATP-grasp domain-containing protein [bacterium]|nr:ATP-grasp domain-containing protein [bacterium]
MKVLVLFGGESVEHEISIISALQVANALKVEHEVIPVYISKTNKMYYDEGLLDLNFYKDLDKNLKNKKQIKINKDENNFYIKKRGLLKKKHYFDIAFPVVHGKGMEDSTIHGYLRFKKIPSVGSSLSFLSACQDKVLTKRILKSEGINTLEYVHISNINEIDNIKLSYPLIVKPNNLGSSIAISRANNKKELKDAVISALSYDTSVLIEPFLENIRELNISVLRKGDDIEVSYIEEVGNNDILTFEDKYEGSSRKGMASLKREVPANVTRVLKNEVEEIAKKTYQILNAKGVIRIDFIVSEKVYVNEVNAIPGSYAFYLWKDKYDFVELTNIVLKEARRETFKEEKLIKTYNKMDIFSKLDTSKSLKKTGP